MLGDFSKQLIEAKCFNIYNLEVKEVIDCISYKQQTLEIMWHLNNSQTQKFRFLKSEDNISNSSKVFGYIESLYLQDNFLCVSSDFRVYLDSKDLASLVSFEFNEKGFAQIIVYPHLQTQKLLVPQVRDKTQKFSEHFTLGLQEFEDKSPLFSWALLNIDEGTFDNQIVILRTIKDGLPYKGLNTQTGQRFMGQEDFNIYEQSNYKLRAKYNKNPAQNDKNPAQNDKNPAQYCFQQISGENFMSTTQKAVTMSPFQEKKSEWTVIKNVINNHFYFMSRDSFLFLSHKQVFMIIEDACIIKGNQSFTIQQEIFVKDESNIEEIEENHKINDLCASEIKMNKSKQQNKSQEDNSETELIQLDFYGNDSHSNTNNNVPSNPSVQSNFSLDIFGSSNQIIQRKIQNKGSNKYLMTYDQKNIGETSDINDATIFKIKRDPLNQFQIQIYVGNSPVGVRKINYTSAVGILDQSKADTEETKFQIDISNHALRFKERVLTIVGGMLFVVSSHNDYRNNQELKYYQQFELIEIPMAILNEIGQMKGGTNFVIEQPFIANNGYVGLAAELENRMQRFEEFQSQNEQNGQTSLLFGQSSQLPQNLTQANGLSQQANNSLFSTMNNGIGLQQQDSSNLNNNNSSNWDNNNSNNWNNNNSTNWNNNNQQQQQWPIQQYNHADHSSFQSQNGHGQQNQLPSQLGEINFQQFNQSSQSKNTGLPYSQSTQMEIENNKKKNGNDPAIQGDLIKGSAPFQALAHPKMVNIFYQKSPVVVLNNQFVKITDPNTQEPSKFTIIDLGNSQIQLFYENKSVVKSSFEQNQGQQFLCVEEPGKYQLESVMKLLYFQGTHIIRGNNIGIIDGFIVYMPNSFESLLFNAVEC